MIRVLPPSVTHTHRSYVYVPVCGVFFSGVLEIIQGREHDVYALEEVTEAGEQEPVLTPILRMVSVRRFAVCRADGMGFMRLKEWEPSDEWLYLVSVLDSAPGRCNCFGYSRWQTCKHLDTIADLLQRGEL